MDGMTNQDPINNSFDNQPVTNYTETEYADATSTNNDLAPTTTAREDAKVEKSIAGSTWVALIIGAILLILLLVFIMQNQENVQLQLFAWEMTFPIGAGMLIAAITGALIMALVGGVRIMQLRRQVSRSHR